MTYTDVPTGPEGDTVARGSRITASIETHLGWMRDLRGEKPPTRYSTPVPTGPTGSTVPSDTDPLDSPLKTEVGGPVKDDSGADGIDESNESRSPQSDDSVLPEDKDEERGRREEETEEGRGEEGQGEKAPSLSTSPSPSPSSSQHNGSVSGVSIAHEPESSKEEGEKEVEKEEVEASNVESEMKDEKKDEKQNRNENRFEDVKQDFTVPGGVRLALLPDFRSKILWLAALVDVDGVVVIVREELHSRLKEIIDTASCLSKGSFLTPPLLSPSPIPSLTSSSPSAEGFCDSFCSLVVRGIRSAAAPLSDAK